MTALRTTKQEGDKLMGSSLQRKSSELEFAKEELEKIKATKDMQTKELDELKAALDKERAEWEAKREEEKREAEARYDGMMKQLTGELLHLREEKLASSRLWDTSKQELEKSQLEVEKMKTDWQLESHTHEGTIKQLQETVQKQHTEYEQEKSKILEDLKQQKQRIEELTKANQQLVSTMDQRDRDLYAAEEERTALRRELENLRMEVERCEAQIKELTAQHEMEAKRIVELDTTLKDLTQAKLAFEQVTKYYNLFIRTKPHIGS